MLLLIKHDKILKKPKFMFKLRFSLPNTYSSSRSHGNLWDKVSVVFKTIKSNFLLVKRKFILLYMETILTKVVVPSKIKYQSFIVVPWTYLSVLVTVQCLRLCFCERVQIYWSRVKLWLSEDIHSCLQRMTHTVLLLILSLMLGSTFLYR